MAKDILFLLKPFRNPKAGPDVYFCTECASLEGLLSYHPELKNTVEARRIVFEKPRQEVVDLLGEALQSSPVLVLAEDSKTKAPDIQVSPKTGRRYVAGFRPIADYLAAAYQVTKLHP